MLARLRRFKARCLVQWHLFWLVRELNRWLKLVGYEEMEDRLTLVWFRDDHVGHRIRVLKKGKPIDSSRWDRGNKADGITVIVNRGERPEDFEVERIVP